MADERPAGRFYCTPSSWLRGTEIAQREERHRMRLESSPAGVNVRGIRKEPPPREKPSTCSGEAD
jgi:hypothetical protein